MKKYLSLLLLAILFVSCSKETTNPVTVDPNATTEYSLYFNKIEVVADCEGSGKGEFFFNVGILDENTNVLGGFMLDEANRIAAGDGESITLNKTVNIKLKNSVKSFLISGNITEYNSILSNVETSIFQIYNSPYNSDNMNAKYTLNGESGYTALTIVKDSKCSFILWFKLTKK